MASDPSTTAVKVFAAVTETPAARALRKAVERGESLSCVEVSPAGQPFFAAWLHTQFPHRPIVVVTEGLRAQEIFQQDVETWLQFLSDSKPRAGSGAPALNRDALFYPAWETLPHQTALPHADLISERLQTLVALTAFAESPAHCAPVVVTSVQAMVQRTFIPEQLRGRTRVVRRGDRIVPLDLVEWLEEQGYEPEAQVNHPGEIALRGGILDVFPLNHRWPVRLEFFGDELESLRHFDSVTQVSCETLDVPVTFPPAGELGVLKRMLTSASVSAAEASTSAAPASAPASALLAAVLDYLPDSTIFLFCQPRAIADQAASYATQVPAGDPFFLSWKEFQSRLEGRKLTTIRLGEEDPAHPREEGRPSVSALPARSPEDKAAADSAPSDPTGALLEISSLDAFRPVTTQLPEAAVAEVQRREFFNQLHRWLRQGFQVLIFCNNDGEQQRFWEIWREYGLAAGESKSALALAPRTVLGALTRGFFCPEAGVVVVTDAEIFGRYKVLRPRRLKAAYVVNTRSLLDIDFGELEVGSYVVHVQHGIGRYQGLQMLASRVKRAENARETEAPPVECLVIEYAASDPAQPAPKLYVPISESHLVGKYVGAGKARPPLNTLGGGRWTKTKEQAERAVRDLAAELLAIHAARESQAGHAFPEDSAWQREFESAFLYEETPDQMKAILAAKADMERPKPMDRLICGDVGYGKTEVAIRAAFKAVMGGKQVAVLVPTTVLAQQHYNTFRERMADYPVRIQVLSRFITARQQKDVVQELADGTADIVIGTHRLVQDDIVFRNLGLVVIDEEQRFGVLHKEKFKLMRRMVDVLTLSATPIPRTLYLALTGARDMSTIETPPQDRLPVETVICEYDERVIRDAIQREINRDGQVFYLHNRVFDIETVATRLRTLLPQARILVGHGQMGADELENVMAAFINGEADVLLSTTIIESGIDIPNANTILIDRADRFGLSDLYQLRGRVGRYKHQAYAYLIIPRHARMLTDARKRISAIKQYSTLGSGFKIAMRDLEIRGAGNLLGAQQSGHIAAVGFELYCQLLKQSVAVLKGEKPAPRLEVTIRLDFLALNPADEEAREPKTRAARKKESAEFEIQVPRETAVYESGRAAHETDAAAAPVIRSPAYLPLNYVTEAQHRLELYRRLAQISDHDELDRLRKEIRDRFGPLPSAVDLLLSMAEIKWVAHRRGFGGVESKGDKLMLTRHGDWVMLNGKFPRLTQKKAKGRITEILRLLQAYPEETRPPARK